MNPDPDLELEELIARSFPAVLTLYGQSAVERRVWSGSGFRIRDTDWIATCAHVVDDDLDGSLPQDLTLRAVDHEGHSYSCRVLELDMVQDLALLVLGGEG